MKTRMIGVQPGMRIEFDGHTMPVFVKDDGTIRPCEVDDFDHPIGGHVYRGEWSGIVETKTEINPGYNQGFKITLDVGCMDRETITLNVSRYTFVTILD